MRARYTFLGGRGFLTALFAALAVAVVTIGGMFWVARDLSLHAHEAKQAIPIIWLMQLALALVSVRLASRLREVALLVRHGVVLNDKSLTIGGTATAWEDVESIESPRGAPGVAFCVRTRDGRRLNVYSRLENVRDLEELISTRIAVGGPPGE